jgi:hypothetical protein
MYRKVSNNPNLLEGERNFKKISIMLIACSVFFSSSVFASAAFKDVDQSY